MTLYAALVHIFLELMPTHIYDDQTRGVERNIGNRISIRVF